VVLAGLLLLLRAVIASLLLIATVVLSYFAALGASWLLFTLVFGFPAVDSQLMLIGFLLLVALGVDYSIFLVSRVRDEVRRHAHRDAHRDGVMRGLAVTGAVISSAGLVLAATFSVLAVLPLVMLVQLGVLVSLGVLLDAFPVRSVLVPALAMDIGRRFWWPSRLERPAPTREPMYETTAGR
jgi:putative drug exporter of the RND superfamily